MRSRTNCPNDGSDEFVITDEAELEWA